MRRLRATWGSWRPDDRWVFRGTAAVVLLACAIESGRVVAADAGPGPGIAVAATVLAVVAAPWTPWTALGLATVAPVLGGLSGWSPIVTWSCAVLLLFAVSSRQGHPVRAAAIVAPGVVIGTLLAPGEGGAVPTALGALISVVAAAAIGSGLRVQHQYRASLEQRAADAVATRELEAERRVAEERVRIARDLHDVIGHEIAVVSMQLGVAEVTLPAGADEARRALDAARDGVRNVLTETQHVLTVLRSASGSGADLDDPTAPAPGIEQLPGLIASYERIGLDVDARLDDVGPVSVPIGVTVYRVVQESLTNAHRHGEGRTTVTLARAGDDLVLEVRNPRRRTPASDPVAGRSSGLGLVGMRERVAAVGGSVQSAADGVLFVVRVRLPTANGAR
ncbi:signal transduction histidine kinase [Curtobacterium sp. PhB42]|uniref:sensor histidine kinase n=1 Tax=unclassified Curtobacterium TaxID=257496 RepID=UPI00104BC142|nr:MULTISPECIES: histidine kinase [unclassified Curtobacterium]TCU83613.1 signal transduction histidine kinase [Curtobacterium sp. PhB191]TDW44502.1 signal transduction histidine kinase [Curtobacterium sp. PhB42]TDW54203.1 signal transduction histidine kinase [Curtobacterium sp. PhB190]